MEIKDVNSLVNQILSGKTDLKSIAFESAFAEMVKEKSEEKHTNELSARESSANSNSAKKSAEAKVASKPEVKTVSKKENDVSVSERKTDSKETSAPDKIVNEKNVVDSKKSEKADSSQKVNEKTNKVEKENVSENGEKTQASEDEDVSVEVDGQAKEATLTATPFVATAVTEVENGGEQEIVETQKVEGSAPTADLADENALVVDAKNPTLTDSEKAPKKGQTAQVAEGEQISSEDVAKAFENFKNVQASAEKNIDGEKGVAQADEKKVSKPAEKAEAVASLVDEKLVTQAEKISEVIGSDKKMKVSVEVKEEKIAYSMDKPINNVVDVAQAIDDASSKGEAKAETIVSQTSTQDSSAQKAAQTNPASFVPSQTAAAQTVATPNVSVEEAAAKIAKTTDLGVPNVSQAQANGKVLLNSELAGKEETKTTFKDVYKGMSKEAVEQVKVNITKSAVKGIDKINIQLKPEELGTIEVKMQIGKDGKILAHIVSNKQETLDILQRDVQSLEKAFSDAGFQTDGQSLSFSYREQQQEENRAQLKSFIGDVLSKESEVANQEYSWNANGGLNIRV